jgi:NADPH:quinone reductase
MVEATGTKKMKAVIYTAPKEYSYAADLKEIPVP